MATVIDICNRALSLIHAQPIGALTESSQEAVLCNQFYDELRLSLLRDHAWNFATRRVVLGEEIDEYTLYTYAYTYPSDCLYARRLLPSATEVVAFEVQANLSNSGRVILTDLEDAELEYTIDIENTNVMDPLFRGALSWLLAANLAPPLKAKTQLVQAMTQGYFAALSRAKMADANEGSTPLQQSNTFVDARA